MIYQMWVIRGVDNNNHNYATIQFRCGKCGEIFQKFRVNADKLFIESLLLKTGEAHKHTYCYLCGAYNQGDFHKSLASLLSPVYRMSFSDCINEKKEKLAPVFENKKLNEKIDKSVLSTRSSGCLQNANILNVGQLTSFTERELLRIKNFGRKSLREVKQFLAEMELSLKQEKGS